MSIISDYNLPQTDRECWERYPNLNWVYNSTRLLDAQHLSWAPFPTVGFTHGMDTFMFDKKIKFSAEDKPHLIYIAPPGGEHVVTDVIIQKGEIKWMGHIKSPNSISENIIGEVDLCINAFVTLFFKKFTGIISVDTIGHCIYAVRLHSTHNMINFYPEEAQKVIKKIFKKITPAIV